MLWAPDRGNYRGFLDRRPRPGRASAESQNSVGRAIIEPMITLASFLLHGIEALPVALEVRPAEPGDIPPRVHRAIHYSGFRPPGPARVIVREAGPAPPACSSRIKVVTVNPTPCRPKTGMVRRPRKSDFGRRRDSLIAGAVPRFHVNPSG